MCFPIKRGLAAVVCRKNSTSILFGLTGQSAQPGHPATVEWPSPAGTCRWQQDPGSGLPRHKNRQALGRSCRHHPCRPPQLTRPAIAEQRLSLTPSVNVRYQLKTPYRDGTTHVMLLRASCPPPFRPAFGCSKSLPAILSNRWILCTGCMVCRYRRDAQERPWRGWRRWCRGRR